MYETRVLVNSVGKGFSSSNVLCCAWIRQIQEMHTQYEEKTRILLGCPEINKCWESQIDALGK